MLKIYINDNPKNSFLRPSKPSVEVSIYFVKKTDSSLQIYIDYQLFYNLTIEN